MNGTVLVVEDDTDLLASLGDALQELGLSADCRQDGIAALEYLRGHRPVAIVLDLLMPRMDGLQFLGVRRTDPELSRIPVIVLSGAPTLTEQARALRADAVLEKPVRLLMLIDAIERLAVRAGRQPAHAAQV